MHKFDSAKFTFEPQQCELILSVNQPLTQLTWPGDDVGLFAATLHSRLGALRFDSTRLCWSWPIDIPIAICFQLTWQVMAAHWKFSAIRWRCTGRKVAAMPNC